MNDTLKNIEDVLVRDGKYASVTSGVSMEPLFRTHRDMVILSRPEGELNRYDVVLYRVGESYVMHRIIAVKDSHYVIRGDNTYEKEIVPKDSVIAVLIAFNRNGKRHEVTETWYKIYSRVWNFIYPIRYIIRRVRRVAARIFGKNQRKNK